MLRLRGCRRSRRQWPTAGEGPRFIASPFGSGPNASVVTHGEQPIRAWRQKPEGRPQACQMLDKQSARRAFRHGVVRGKDAICPVAVGNAGRSTLPTAIARHVAQSCLTGLGRGPRLDDMKIDIERLSLRELNALVRAAEQRKTLLSIRRPAAVVRQELTAMAASHSYTIEELFGDRPVAPVVADAPKRRKRVKAPAKYRDPENKRNTWSGRGRMPSWLAAKTKRGQAAADFLIPGLGRPTAKKSSSIGRKSIFKQG